MGEGNKLEHGDDCENWSSVSRISTDIATSRVTHGVLRNSHCHQQPSNTRDCICGEKWTILNSYSTAKAYSCSGANGAIVIGMGTEWNGKQGRGTEALSIHRSLLCALRIFQYLTLAKILRS